VFLFPKVLKTYVEQDAKFIWPGGMLVQIFSGREPARYEAPIRNQVKAFVSLPDETRGIAKISSLKSCWIGTVAREKRPILVINFGNALAQNQ
jgi:hypothetical protein